MYLYLFVLKIKNWKLVILKYIVFHFKYKSNLLIRPSSSGIEGKIGEKFVRNIVITLA